MTRRRPNVATGRTLAVVAAFLALTACGSSEEATPEALTIEQQPSGCPDARGLASSLEPDIAYDYTPAADPVALADRTAVSFRASGISSIVRSAEWVVFTVDHVEVIADNRGDQTAAPAEFALEVGSLYEGPPDGSLFADVELVVFAHSFEEAPSGLVADIEGLWIGCGFEAVAHSVVVTPSGPGWSDRRSIDKIATDVRRSRGLPASVSTTSGLACYGELAEVGILEPLMGGDVPGFDTPREAADDWVRNDQGARVDASALQIEIDLSLVRFLDEHGNAQVVLDLTETQSGGYVVETEGVCFYP